MKKGGTHSSKAEVNDPLGRRTSRTDTGTALDTFPAYGKCCPTASEPTSWQEALGALPEITIKWVQPWPYAEPGDVFRQQQGVLYNQGLEKCKNESPQPQQSDDPIPAIRAGPCKCCVITYLYSDSTLKFKDFVAGVINLPCSKVEELSNPEHALPKKWQRYKRFYPWH